MCIYIYVYTYTYVIQDIDVDTRVALLLSKRARRETWPAILGKPRDTVSLIEGDRYHDFAGCLCVPWRTTFRSFRGSTFHALFRPRVPFLRLNVWRMHALFIKREYTEIKFSRISDANHVSLWLCWKWSMLLDWNRVSLSVATSLKYIFLRADREIMQNLINRYRKYWCVNKEISRVTSTFYSSLFVIFVMWCNIW